jgi:hypothetical protein
MAAHWIFLLAREVSGSNSFWFLRKLNSGELQRLSCTTNKCYAQNWLLSQLKDVCDCYITHLGLPDSLIATQ